MTAHPVDPLRAQHCPVTDVITVFKRQRQSDEYALPDLHLADFSSPPWWSFSLSQELIH